MFLRYLPASALTDFYTYAEFHYSYYKFVPHAVGQVIRHQMSFAYMVQCLKPSDDSIVAQLLDNNGRK